MNPTVLLKPVPNRNRERCDKPIGADNQQGSQRMLLLTPQRLHAELLETRMKIESTPHGDVGTNVNKVAVPEGAAGSPPFREWPDALDAHASARVTDADQSAPVVQ